MRDQMIFTGCQACGCNSLKDFAAMVEEYMLVTWGIPAHLSNTKNYVGRATPMLQHHAPNLTCRLMHYRFCLAPEIAINIACTSVAARLLAF